MKRMHLYFGIVFLASVISCKQEAKTEQIETSVNEPVKIIFDSDMGPDYDDVGAITLLHSLASKGECEILATVSSDGHPSIAPTFEVFNRYFQLPDIPIGSPDESAPAFTADNHWNDSLIVKFLPSPKTNADYPSALEVYRKVLSAQEDKSVTIVTVGFTSNLADLLASGPDAYSELDGLALINKKVTKWVAMAGAFPEGREFNVFKDSVAAFDVFHNWPTPILFSGFEIGAKIKTGRKVAMNGSPNSPVRWAYDYNLRTYMPNGEVNRNSWDHTAVLCAVRDPEKYFYVNGPGRFVIHENGTNSWDADTDKQHFFLVHKYPYQQIADIIDDLMMYEPAK